MDNGQMDNGRMTEDEGRMNKGLGVKGRDDCLKSLHRFYELWRWEAGVLENFSCEWEMGALGKSRCEWETSALG